MVPVDDEEVEGRDQVKEETKYGHLQKIYVRLGQYVKRGDKIGEVGNTGISTAPHLHYEVHYKDKPVNPTDYYFNNIKFE